MSDWLKERVDRALDRRQVLFEVVPAGGCRLIHGVADGFDGLVIEKFGPVLVVQCHENQLKLCRPEVEAVVAYAKQRTMATTVYRKTFLSDRAEVSPELDAKHRQCEPWMGDAVESEIEIVENGLRFGIQPYDGFSVGLFLEQRENRRRVRDAAAGRRVLNAFAYTCGFSVAAATGGAVSVDSVDLSKRYLEWGKRNFERNGLDLEPHRFFCSDIFEFFKRARRQDRRYDLIVLDPPTFGRLRRPRRVFVLEKELGQLCEEAIERLEPDGLILLATNCRNIDPRRLEEALTDAAEAAGRSCEVVERPGVPLDFEGDDDYAKSVWVRVEYPPRSPLVKGGCQSP